MDRIVILKKKLKSELSDSSKIIVYNELADIIHDEKEWTYYNNKALQLANKKLLDAEGESKKFYLRYKAEATANVGYYYDDHGNIQKSLEKYYESLHLYDEAGFEEGKAATLGNIGIILLDQEDFTEAREYLEKGLELKKKYAPDQLAVNYINLGSVLDGLNDTVGAFRYYNLALEAALNVEDRMNSATAYTNLGTYYNKKKNYKEAIHFTRLGYENYTLENDLPGQSWTLCNIGQNLCALGDIDSALTYLLKAADIAIELGFPELLSHVSSNLYDVYSIKGEWKLAHEQYLIHQEMSDSLYNVTAQKNALKQKLNYDHDLEKKTLSLKAQEEQKRSRQAIVFVSAGLLMLIVFTFFIFRRLKITRRQKLIIEVQQQETEIQKEIIEEKNTEIVDSINYAKRLQNAILPNQHEVSKLFKDSFILYLPKDIVAGDFYWLYNDKNQVFIAAADCTGHGVPGAMVSVVCANALDRAVKEFNLKSTNEILDKVTELVIQTFDTTEEDVKDGMDISLCRIDVKSGNVQFSGANNPLWVFRNKTADIEVVKGDRQPIGKYEDLVPFKAHEIACEKGDWIYLFSDGYVDQFGGDQGKKFKTVSFKKLILQLGNKVGSEQELCLVESFQEWKGELDQLDDICVIGIQF